MRHTPRLEPGVLLLRKKIEIAASLDRVIGMMRAAVARRAHSSGFLTVH
jgi:hypothetical protein